jgi:hypothetical protein
MELGRFSISLAAMDIDQRPQSSMAGRLPSISPVTRSSGSPRAGSSSAITRTASSGAEPSESGQLRYWADVAGRRFAVSPILVNDFP